MSVDRTAASTSVIDVLDHILDKGIVIDAWVRVSLAGIDLVTVEARVVVASIGTYLSYANVISQLEPVSRPAIASSRDSLELQLQRVREQIDRSRFDPQTPRRRAEDRVRDERRDVSAITITKH